MYLFCSTMAKKEESKEHMHGVAAILYGPFLTSLMNLCPML